MFNFFGSSWNLSLLSFTSRCGQGLPPTPPSSGQRPNSPGSHAEKPGTHLALHLLLRAVFLPRAPISSASLPGRRQALFPGGAGPRSSQPLWRETGAARPIPPDSGAPRRQEAARHPTDTGAARPVQPTGFKSAL